MTKLSKLEIISLIILKPLIIYLSLSDDENSLYGSSLNLFGPDNGFRCIIAKMVRTTAFQLVYFLVLMIHCIMLTINTPLVDPKGSVADAAYYIDLITMIFFSLEIAVKVIAFGFVYNGPDSYLRNGWNVLDFAITIVGILGLSVDTGIYALQKVIMMFRVLRAIRIIALNEGFRLCILAIVTGFPQIFQTMFIAMMFFSVFSIISVHYFGGILNYIVCFSLLLLQYGKLIIWI